MTNDQIPMIKNCLVIGAWELGFFAFSCSFASATVFSRMRLVEVAKKLGMTGQELRRELSQVDFGVKPTDREVADGLAQGIIRFIARKHGIEVKEDAPASDAASESEEKEKSTSSEEQDQEVASESKKEEHVSDVDPNAAATKVHVLRKL